VDLTDLSNRKVFSESIARFKSTGLQEMNSSWNAQGTPSCDISFEENPMMSAVQKFLISVRETKIQMRSSVRPT
jgi:hypothetical protein